MKKILHMTVLTIFVLSFMIATVACGSDSEETPTPTPTPAPTPKPEVTTPKPESKPTSEGYVVDITEEGFSPQTITVPAGTKVTWHNRDPLRRHWVKGVDGSFDTRVIPVEARMTWTFNEPGVYEYYCVYHREETGTVIVE
jgi:plastocyanin